MIITTINWAMVAMDMVVTTIQASAVCMDPVDTIIIGQLTV